MLVWLEEKRDNMKDVDQDMDLYSIFCAIESMHRIKATLPFPVYELSC